MWLLGKFDSCQGIKDGGKMSWMKVELRAKGFKSVCRLMEGLGVFILDAV